MTIVFIHGIAGSHAYFAKLQQELPEFSMAFDLPGFGSKKDTEKQLTMGDYLDFISKELEVVRPEEQIVLVGHSFGGVLALLWASRYQSRVSKLVLLNTPLAETPEKMRKGLNQGKFSWSYLIEFYPHLSRIACKGLCQRGYMSKFRFMKPGFIPEEVFLDYTKHDFKTIKHTYHLLGNTATIPLVKKINIPILVLYGSKELGVFHTKVTQDNVTQKQIPGGHHILHQSFDLVKKELTDFIS